MRMVVSLGDTRSVNGSTNVEQGVRSREHGYIARIASHGVDLPCSYIEWCESDRLLILTWNTHRE